METSGPEPRSYDLQSIGAVVVEDKLDKSFYVELKPISGNYLSESVKVSGLSPEALRKRGTDPTIAMTKFATWIGDVSLISRPVFVGFGATFDWMWINTYFLQYYGKNPFGINGLDIKSYYAGKFGKAWRETTKTAIAKTGTKTGNRRHTHNALDDAMEQADLFAAIMKVVPGQDPTQSNELRTRRSN